MQLLIRVCTVCLNYRKIRVKWNILSPQSGPFSQPTQRQLAHQCCQCFDYTSSSKNKAHKYKFLQKSLVYVSHTINVSAELNSLGFFICKSSLNPARIVQQFLQQNIVGHLNWPARSPDLSPIKHVWDILGQRVWQRVPRPRTLQALGAALKEDWRRIPQLQIARHIRSMRCRCVACIDATGGHTRYWQICEVLLVTLVIFHTNFLIHF